MRMCKGKQLQKYFVDEIFFFFFCECLTVVAPASLKTTFTQMQNDYIYFYIYYGHKQGALGSVYKELLI